MTRFCVHGAERPMMFTAAEAAQVVWVVSGVDAA
jgi:hypothetical protein